MKFNIRFKLLLFTFSIVLLVGGSISLHSLFLGQRRMLAAFEDDARRTAALIGGAVVNDIYFLDLRSLHRRLESSRLNSDITYTLIMDLEGAVLSDGTSANVLRDKKSNDPFSVALLQTNDWISKVEPGLLKVGGPVFMPDRSRVGYLSVGFSLQRTNGMVRETTKSSLYLTAFAFGIAFVLAFVLAARFSRPVLTVTRAAKEIGEGRLDTRLSVSRSDELGLLAQSVNLMAETLQRRHAEVRHSVELLEQEIAERKGAEETVRQSEERFRSLVSVITDVPWVTDATGAFVTPQPSWEAYTGQTWEEHHGFGWANAVHPDDRQRFKEIWNEACLSRTLYQSEGRCWHAPTQQWRYVMAKATPLLKVDGSVREWVGTCTDVDDQKRAKERLENMVAERTRELQQANAALLRDMDERRALEEELLQAHKMESIGMLAGGIAHDFNNLLNIIQAYAFMIRDCGIHNKETDESLNVINETIRRGSALVQQLLAVGRKSTGANFESVDVNVLVDGMIALVGQTFPKTIELSSSLQPNIAAITADKNQIEQALLNLLVNARDAMPDGGSLTFKTQCIDGAMLRHLGKSRVERYICIEVTDTGIGMDESTRKRIFEPFFTTKDKSQKAGLGLSVVYGIVKNHNGFIDVESIVTKGTSFRLYFPITNAEVAVAESVSQRDELALTMPNSSPTVLVVEDEEAMLYALEKMLVNRGYKVLRAADGEMAVRLYQRHKESIDVVLLDMGLPKLSGRDVLFKIKQEKKDAKVVIASGYFEEALRSEIDQAGVKNFVHKPYMPDELIHTIQSLIEPEAV
jgi:PAS domain S-box-containing protein